MRREFTRAVRVEIIKRAGLGGLRCENCGIWPGKHFEIDHRIPDALQIDKTARLTASDGWLLCIPCHKEKTASEDTPAIAKAKRREARHLGAGRKTEKRPKPPLVTAPGMTNLARRFPGAM